MWKIQQAMGPEFKLLIKEFSKYVATKLDSEIVHDSKRYINLWKQKTMKLYDITKVLKKIQKFW